MATAYHRSVGSIIEFVRCINYSFRVPFVVVLHDNRGGQRGHLLDILDDTQEFVDFQRARLEIRQMDGSGKNQNSIFTIIPAPR